MLTGTGLFAGLSITRMGAVLTMLAKVYPVWLRSCDSYILYFIPEHRRFYDGGRDSLRVAWICALSLLMVVALIAIALLVNRIVNIVKNHF